VEITGTDLDWTSVPVFPAPDRRMFLYNRLVSRGESLI
jgi:hypothetical protein